MTKLVEGIGVEAVVLRQQVGKCLIPRVRSRLRLVHFVDQQQFLSSRLAIKAENLVPLLVFAFRRNQVDRGVFGIS